MRSHISLKAFHTFGIEKYARYFTEIHSIDELRGLLSDHAYRGVPKIFIGQGSNILFTRDVDGVVAKIAIHGIEKRDETDDYVWIRAGAGVIWDDLARYCVERGYYGIENLSLIPGTVGAAPIQNIGAYGVEVADSVADLDAVSTDDYQVRRFFPDECRFGYRHSIFKDDLKGKYVIVNVTLKLDKRPTFQTQYHALRRWIDGNTARYPSLNMKTIRQAVTEIRQDKLPDPARFGNAGSFFKNPQISTEKSRQLLVDYPQIPLYTASENTSGNTVKVAAGWLIEQCGWKGKRVGDAGVYEKQALVLINHGRANGADIMALAEQIRASVKEKFAIRLEFEVDIQ